MLGAAQRYRELTIDLLLARELAGGALPQEEELRRATELHHCWEQMTDAEQEFEECLLEEVPGAPADLLLVDRRVDRGEHLLPKQAA